MKLITTDKLAARCLVGRTIAEVRIARFDDGRGGIATQPSFVLDNGSVIAFSVNETDVGEYGIAVILVRPKRRER